MLLRLFNINGENWRVVIVSGSHPALYRTDGSKSIGACDDAAKTIYIQDGLTDWRMRKVLCHEITHAAMFSYDVNLTIDQEELLADLFATYGEEIMDVTNRVFIKIKMGVE